MAWNVLIYINDAENSVKFWSYSDDNKVVYGRIGSTGRVSERPDDYITQKVQEKLNKGYRIYGNAVNYYSPTEEDARNFWNQSNDLGTQRDYMENIRERANLNNVPISQIEELPIGDLTASSIELQNIAPAPRVRNRTIVETGTNSDLKTDNEGYLNKIREGYTRDVFSDFNDYYRFVKPLQVKSLIEDMSSSEKTKNAIQYFNKIPKNNVYNKPNDFEMLREHQRPTYYVLFYKDEVIAIYGMHRGQGFCDFLSIKSNTRYRVSMLKSILMRFPNLTEQSKILLRIKNKNLKNEIKEIAPFFIEDGTSLVYNRTDLENGISLTDELNGIIKPKRWMD